MNIIDIKKLPIVDFNVNRIIALNQKWNNSSKYLYINKPRPDNGITLIISGIFEYTDVNGNVTVAKKGDVVYIPDGHYYEAKFFNDNNCTSSILINFVLTDTAGNKIILDDKIRIVGNSSDTNISKHIKNIAYEFRTSVDKLKIKTIFLQLLHELSKTTNIPFNIDMCGKYLNENFLKNISVATLANRCCLSETTFRKCFKEKYKISPIKYINRNKINLACEMLKSSDIKIEEISTLLGFYDSSYFCRTFKAVKKLTPLQYKQQLK